MLAGINAQAIAPKDLRVYINPGHGSYTGNDRPIQTIGRAAYSSSNTDTTGFFESNTDLEKGFGVLERLIDYGLTFDRTLNQTNSNPSRVGAALDMRNNIVMSRVKSGPYPTILMGGDETYASAYNRSLSEIAHEVDINNFDLFLSIHSNAASLVNKANYPLWLYRGADGSPEVANSDKVGSVIWKYLYPIEHMSWSAYSLSKANLRGDWDFYGSTTTNSYGYKGYLGVLKHGVLGGLIEGYYHTYPPAMQRAMNDDVCYQEGKAYAQAIAEYFGISADKTGDIYGIIRDKYTTMASTQYSSLWTFNSSNDALKPINGATVKLLSNGKVVDTYTTDNEWNGAFVFDRLTPGTYYIEVSHSDYEAPESSECGPFTVTAGGTVYPKVFMETKAHAGTGNGSYHGFHINASQELIDHTDVNTPLSADVWNVGGYMTLQVLFQPEYNPILVNDELTEITKDGTTLGKHTDGKYIDYAAPIANGTYEVLLSQSLPAGNIDGMLVVGEDSSEAMTMGADGLAYVTCPSQCYINGTLTDVTGGDIRLRFCTRNKSGAKSRLGDTETCYVLDINGVYVTISAPTGVEVSSHFTQANLTTSFNGSTALGTKDDLGGMPRTAIFPLGHTTADNVPQDLRYDGKGTNSWNLCSYQRNTSSAPDDYGFPIRFVDIVFKGVKAGEKVGWTNYQSLHPGYTPVAYSAPSGIADISVDTDTDAPVEYFNLQGVRVDNPTPGLYIKRQGATVTKIIVR
jgi:hypothetical protein